MLHTIRKQIFDLWVHRRLDALALQQRVSDRFWMDIAPELEAYFDEVSNEESTIIIDRLEIDLGLITEEMIDSGEWGILFREKLEAALQEKLIDIALQHGGKVISGVDNVFSQWLYFIRHGYLPWNSARPSEQWFQQVLESLAGNYNSAAALRKLLAGNAITAERIALHHSPEFLSHLVELLTAEKQSSLPAAIAEIAAWLDDINIKYSPVTSLKRKAIERMIWVKVLQKVSADEAKQDTSTIITFLVKRWLQLTPELLHALVRHEYSAEKFPVIEPVIADITKEVMKDDQDDLQLQPRNVPGDAEGKIRAPVDEEGGDLRKEGKEGKGGKEGLPDDGQRALEGVSAGLEKKERAMDGDVADDQLVGAKEGIYITHAGLVLLHPFLHTFFRKMELVKDGKFINEEKQERAVCLLHELAASGTPLQEYDLVLEKLLCAWPMHLPIDTSIELTQIEKEEARHLLVAAIEQWEILRNAAPLALQETFLQRGGKLFYKNGKWYLQVEKTSVDVLLAHLPWMISMIKLPWMKELLMVEWT